MKKFFTYTLLSSSLLLGNYSAKADFAYWSWKMDNDITGTNDHYEIYTCSASGNCTERANVTDTPISSYFIWDGSKNYVNPENNNLIIYFRDSNDGTNYTTYIREYDSSNFSFSTIESDWKLDYDGTRETNILKQNSDGSIQIGADDNDIDIVSDGLNIDGAAVITKNADGTIQIGKDENDIDITSEGLAIDGEPLITKKANGELHIGKNSWITKEENGRQKVYAKDANGNPIPIDYTNGTKLLINGRDVEQSINNVGALSAALTGLPTVPTETTLACGLGTGTHGGDFAFSGGCASKVNDKLSINYAASMTMPGQDYAGDFEDTFSARAGFVWKLGKATKPTQISMKETRELKEEIADLKENNKNIIAQNNALLARLERLEKVALGDLKSKDLAVYTHK